MPSGNLISRSQYAMGNRAAGDELMDLIGIGVSPFGTIFYVDADNGDDDTNDGRSSTSAFKTIAAAYAQVTTNKHDVILLSAGGGHTLADELLLTKNRFHIVGTGHRDGAYMGQRSRLSMGVTTGSAIAAIQITGVGITLNNLKITSADTLSTSLYAVADGGEFTILRNCWLEKNTDLDQTTAAELLANGDTSTYLRCAIGNGIYTPSVARQNVLCTRETITGKVARSNVFEDCIFQARVGSTTFVNVRATTNDLERIMLFKRCFFHAVKTSTATQDEAFGIASALTDAQIALMDCMTVGITNIATAASGVFTNQPAGADLGGKGIEVT